MSAAGVAAPAADNRELLLHGIPETHLMWHRVAPRLARRELAYDRFHVVGHDRKARADDLRGSAVAAGHFLAEEAAEETARQLLDFLG